MLLRFGTCGPLCNDIRTWERRYSQATHPYRLYNILCQVARIHLETRTNSTVYSLDTPQNGSAPSNGPELDVQLGVTGPFEADNESYRLGDWYCDNQARM